VPIHAFVDETKVRGLTVVTAIFEPRDLAHARSVMNSLRMKGQERLHFKSERDSRRRQIMTAICELPVVVDIYDTWPATTTREARPAVLHRLIADLASNGAHRMVLEQDDSVMHADRRTLYESVRAHGVEGRLVYEHLRAKSEPLLWIPDAVAWCWVKDNNWRERAKPVVRNVVTV